MCMISWVLMIAVNYPSSVLELLLREFLVFIYKASKKPQSSFPIHKKNHSKVRFASRVGRINSSPPLKSLIDFWTISEIVPCAVAWLLPLVQFDKDVTLAKLPSVAWVSGSHQPPESPCSPVAREPCNLKGSWSQGGQARDHDAAENALNQSLNEHSVSG